MLELRAQAESLQVSIDKLNAIIDKKRVIKTQSGVAQKLGSDGPVSSKATDENLGDIMGADKVDQHAGVLTHPVAGQENILDLADFLARPVEIYNYSVPNNSSLDVVLNVWDLYTKIPSVRAKLKNYAYLRGNLHIRIAVSGCPFDYGRLIGSYQPMAYYNMNLDAYALMGVSGRQGLLNYLSQSPGAFTMNVNENQPTEIVCPYIGPKHMFRLFNTSTTALSGSTSYEDLLPVGDLYLYTLNPIKSTNSVSPTDVAIQIYAWMEDVGLGTSTATVTTIVTESGSDEREAGPVERFASTVVKVANVLTEVPILAPFAAASSMVASVVGKVAALFGWSRPVHLAEPVYVKNRPYASAANVVGSETTSRIVLDPKQELTVDPRVVAIDHDEMTIAGLARKRSYLTTFTWNTSDPVMDPIYSTRVVPTKNTVWTHLGNTKVQPTAMSFAASPFTYWRGDIVFRIEIVCSAFHRGKLLILFEPNLAQFGLMSASTSLNKQFLKIIDIQQTQTVDFKVNWASSRSWLLVPPPSMAATNEDPSQIDYSVGRYGYANGYISIMPFTALQSPDGGSIEVNVYVHCENLQVNGLTSANLPTERQIYTESGVDHGGIESSTPVSVVDLNLSTANAEHICQEHFGEQPLSFRALLKRYVTIAAPTSGDFASAALLTGPIIPDNGLLYSATSFVHPNLFDYLRLAFLGMRGGVRYRFNIQGAQSYNGDTAKVMLSPPTSTVIPLTYSVVTGYGQCTLEGSEMFVPETNGGIEVEFPMYTNNLFLCSFSSALTPTTPPDNFETVFFRNFQVVVEVSSLSNTLAGIQFATAEDFSFLRFQGAPMYSVS